MNNSKLRHFTVRHPFRSFMVTFWSTIASRSSRSAPRSSASCLHLNAPIPCQNRHGLTGTACSTLGVQLYFLLFQFLWRMLFNSLHTERHLYEKGDGTTMSLIFKAVRLVNALVFMYTTESIITAPLHRSNKLLHNFHMNLHFYSHYFWFFIRRVSLCAPCSLRGEVRDQAGAGKDSVSCSKTL